jgi:hypothetical protein
MKKLIPPPPPFSVFFLLEAGKGGLGGFESYFLGNKYEKKFLEGIL